MSDRAELRCVLALDLGTSSCKARIVSVAGKSLATATAEYKTQRPAPLWAEQNPEHWLAASTKAIRKAIDASKISVQQIEAIGLTSAAHIAVLLDQKNKPVRNAILWNDQRTTKQVDQLERAAGAEILRLTYQAVSTSWSLPHLAWVRENDAAAWRRVRKMILSKDYLGYWLTGRFVTDPATALSAQLFDPRRNQWSPQLCKLTGVDVAMLPEIQSACSVTGELQPGIARKLGLRSGIPVITGTLDSATELISSGALVPGDGMARLASAGGIQILMPKPVADRRRITYPYALGGYWYSQGGTNCCAAAVEWAKNLVAPDGAISFEQWDKLAASVAAGADGLMFHPYLAGERAPYWRPDLRGSFSGLTLGHQRSHLARAVYEGTAFSIRDALSVLPTNHSESTLLTLAGGGAKSVVWSQILADVLGKDLRIVPDCDSSYGAAMFALFGCGISSNFNQLIKRQAKRGRVIRHHADQFRVYSNLFAIYRQKAAGMLAASRHPS